MQFSYEDDDDDTFYDASEGWDGQGVDEEHAASKPWEQSSPPEVTGAANGVTTVVATAALPEGTGDATAVATAPSPVPIQPPDWPLHRAAFSGDISTLRQALQNSDEAQRTALDPQGNTALHVAVMRGKRECVDMLLEAGVSAGLRNARGWVPALQAIEMRDRELALHLLRAEFHQMKAEVKAKKQAVYQRLWQLPDFSTQLHWELTSNVPGVGLLLSRYAPHDTYTIWKKGSQIRVDGSLMGVREAGQSLLPEWKRGHFSLLYNGSGGGDNGRPLAVFVNRTKKKWVDLQAARKRMGTLHDEALAKEVDELMAKPRIVKKKVSTSGFKFSPVSGWLSKEVIEKVEGWETKVYEASGTMMSVTKYKAPCTISAGSTWEQYLAMTFPQDVVEQEAMSAFSSKMFSDKSSKRHGTDRQGNSKRQPGTEQQGSGASKGCMASHALPSQQGNINLDKTEHLDPDGLPPELYGELQASGVSDSRPSGSTAKESLPTQPEAGPSTRPEMPSSTNVGDGKLCPGSITHHPDPAKPPKAGSNKPVKKLTGRCWMASGFPLSLQQLLPLLDVIGSANKHLAKVSKFMAKYGNMDMFPVKIQVPLVFTVYALVQFKQFQLLSPAGAQSAARPASSGGLFRRKTASAPIEELPPDFFEVPAGYEKYEPKLFTKAEEQLQRRNTGADDLDL